MKLVSIHLLLIFFLSSSFLKAQIWTLQACLDTALVASPQLTMEEGKAKILEAGIRILGRSTAPRLEIQADYKYLYNMPYQLLPLSIFNGPEGQYKEVQFGVPHNLGLQVQGSWLLYNPGLRERKSKLQTDLERVKLEEKQAQALIWFEVHRMYYAAQVLHQQMLYVAQGLAAVRAFEDYLKLVQAQDLLTTSRLRSVAARRQATEAKYQMLLLQKTQLLEGLRFLIGLEEGRDFDLVWALPETPSETAAAAETSFEMQFISLKIKGLDYEVKARKQVQKPQVLLLGQYAWNGFGYDGQPEAFMKFFPQGFVGLQARMPLYQPSLKAELQQKSLERQQFEKQQKLLNAKQNLAQKQAQNRLHFNRQIWETQQQQVQNLQAVLEERNLQHSLGTLSWELKLEAEQALQEAQNAAVQALAAYLEADLELRRLEKGL